MLSVFPAQRTEAFLLHRASTDGVCPPLTTTSPIDPGFRTLGIGLAFFITPPMISHLSLPGIGRLSPFNKKKFSRKSQRHN
jgi:hypothetical protein